MGDRAALQYGGFLMQRGRLFSQVESGIASADKTHKMAVKVEVRDGETIREAYRRLAKEVLHAYRRQWYKTRPGSYDKPSYRRHRREALRQRSVRGNVGGRTVYVELRGLYSRTAPFTHTRKRQKKRREMELDGDQE